jgi:hypothetical protein
MQITYGHAEGQHHPSVFVAYQQDLHFCIRKNLVLAACICRRCAEIQEVWVRLEVLRHAP